MKNLGIKIAAGSLLLMSVVFLITQSVWVNNEFMKDSTNNRAITSLMFILLATIASIFINVVVWAKLRVASNQRVVMLTVVNVTLLFIIISFAVSIGVQHDWRNWPGIKVYGANIAFFIIGMIGYITGEVMINGNFNKSNKGTKAKPAKAESAKSKPAKAKKEKVKKSKPAKAKKVETKKK